MQYQVSTNMVITHRGRWEVPKESGNHVGQIANWRILTSASGGTPNTLAESWIRYGIGIDESQEICHIATQFALISAKGAWYTIQCFVDAKDDPLIKSLLIENEIDVENDEAVTKFFKFQGMDNLSTFISDNQSLQDFLIQQVKDVLL